MKRKNTNSGAVGDQELFVVMDAAVYQEEKQVIGDGGGG